MLLDWVLLLIHKRFLITMIYQKYWHLLVDVNFVLFLFQGALSYAELGTMITKSGAEYAYIQEAFSPLHRTVGPIPAFLFAWTSVLILKPALFGVTSMSFAVYVVEPFYGPCGSSDLVVKIVAVLCLCELIQHFVVWYWSVEIGGSFTVCEASIGSFIYSEKIIPYNKIL